MKFAALILACLTTGALAQAPEVPHKMKFAGMTLTIRDDARREIQKDVDMLTQSPRHMAVKVERAKTYFPIIEKIFEEERVPDDFKFLVLQESALISDAVSVSNAVGFWQFKDFTAMEMGLRVDDQVDERMNIVSSTRAAARYFKKNNYYFNNWVYALQAYQMGAGGVLQSVKDVESGTKHMEITSKTYWYVKKYLAHKVAYEAAVKGPGAIQVITFTNHEKKPLTELAHEFALPHEELLSYNKWVRQEYIPGDKPYAVAIPTAGDGKALSQLIARTNKQENTPRVGADPAVAKNDKMPVNGIMAMRAHTGESTTSFVKRAGIDLSYFLKCNDLSISDRLVADDYYYVKKKKSKATVPHHVAQAGETLWSISQRYGVQLRKLKKYNGVTGDAPLKEGFVVSLSGKRLTSQPIQNMPVAEVAVDETFNWSAEPEAMLVSIQQNPVVVQPTLPSKSDDTTSLETIYVRPEKHTVQAGETLYAISKQYQVAVVDILKWNNLKMEDGIKPGQVLSLQETRGDVSSPVEPATIMHQVKSSDTLYSIARQYEVTIKDLMAWNNKKDFALTVGESLKILKK